MIFVLWLGKYCLYDHFFFHARLKLILVQGYLPLPTSLRSSTLARKRSEYQNMVDLAFAKGREGLDQQIWHQIEIDVPRTRPGVKLWMHAETQRVRFAEVSMSKSYLKHVVSESRTYSLRLGNQAPS